MSRGTRTVLLGVMSLGVFLSGLELMITAVALPAIVADLSDWTQLRLASWIVNAYLLVAIITMPLAGRLVDRAGIRGTFLWALVLFVVGSALAGRSGDLPELIVARLIQAVGGGALVPVTTAAASHLFEGDARPRALGVIGALTFLGMAAGPFAGAWVLEAIHPAAALDALGIEGAARDALAAPWRYVFYLNVPLGVAALAIGWAATAGWETPRHRAPVDILGAIALSVGLGALLAALTLAGSAETSTGSGPLALLAIAGIAVVAVVVAVLVGLRHPDPFINTRWFAVPAFSSAGLVSLLTGYGFATAIIGGAVFVDRVLYGGPDVQRVALGALAGATAVGALASGFVLRAAGLRLTTVVGLLLSVGALVRMAGWTAETSLLEVSGWLALFGLGFGLTVTPRSTSAVEALGQAAFGVASATVTVARMIGMAIGLAAIAAFGSTIIDRLYDVIYDPANPDAYKGFVPVALRDRPLHDGLVVEALERWASREAAEILVGIFLVAAAVTAVAILPALLLGSRGRKPTAAVGAPSPSDASTNDVSRRGVPASPSS